MFYSFSFLYSLKKFVSPSLLLLSWWWLSFLHGFFFVVFNVCVVRAVLLIVVRAVLLSVVRAVLLSVVLFLFFVLFV